MIKSMFIPQSQLEAWVGAGEAAFEDNVLTVPGRGIFELQPAVRITNLIDGSDGRGWLGQTLTVEDIQGCGAEHFQGTVIIGDTGYECEDGFLGTSQGARPVAPDGAPSAVVSVPSAPAAASAQHEPAVTENPSPVAGGEDVAAGPVPTAEGAGDVDLLADFLLKNLT